MCVLKITDVSVLFCYLVMYSSWQSEARFLALQTKKRASVPYWLRWIVHFLWILGSALDR